MKKIVENIKNHAFSDYRSHMSGVLCDIYGAFQTIGMSSTLSVAPVGFQDPQNVDPEQKRYNVIPCGSPGIYGFPLALAESYYAYVLTDDVSKIEGKPAIIIPKSLLLSNPGPDWKVEGNILSKDSINSITVRKEDLIVSRKYT